MSNLNPQQFGEQEPDPARDEITKYMYPDPWMKGLLHPDTDLFG